MKKNRLFLGILYMLAGAVFLLAALCTDSPFGGILFGLAGAGIGPGIAMIWRYFYWSKPDRRKEYEERLETERIELHDELKEKLRDKSGRYAYLLGLGVISGSMVVFSVLGSLGILRDARQIVLFLGAYLVLQIVSGIAFFQHLLKKY